MRCGRLALKIQRTFGATWLSRVGPDFNLHKSKGSVLAHGSAYNCLDVHVEQGRGERVALNCECNDVEGQHASFIYEQLFQKVCQLANGMHWRRVLCLLPHPPRREFGGVDPERLELCRDHGGWRDEGLETGAVEGNYR